MNFYENEIASFHCEEDVRSYVESISSLVKNHPFIVAPYRGIREETEKILSAEGIQYYPTVKKTTLFYDRNTDCFFKILHPLTFKAKFRYTLTHISRNIYNLSKYLSSKGIKTAAIKAYGKFRKTGSPFYVIEKVSGKSLFDLLVREGTPLPEDTYKKIIDEIAKLHAAGYWFRDAHLTDIFIKDFEVSGIIDIDGIRKNTILRLHNLARDLAGFNHPKLPINVDEKRALLQYYIRKMNIENEDRFLQSVKKFTKKRWKRSLSSE